jgi:hypothetical protein
MHSADGVLLAVADAVENATMKLMASEQAQPHMYKLKAPGDRSWLRWQRARYGQHPMVNGSNLLLT